MTSKHSTLTQARLKELLHYNPKTGAFTWLTKPRYSTINVGDIAGWQDLSKSGNYQKLKIDGETYRCHRLAFLYMTGFMPLKGVDHDDGNGLNNIWSNLHDTGQVENMKNKKRYVNNASGCTGVYFDKATTKWKAQIIACGEHLHLGRFPEIFDAFCARKSAECKYGYHNNHGRITE